MLHEPSADCDPAARGKCLAYIDQVSSPVEGIYAGRPRYNIGLLQRLNRARLEGIVQVCTDIGWIELVVDRTRHLTSVST